jgi:hypothetical protein
VVALRDENAAKPGTWERSRALLESNRGQLNYAKAVALLLDIESGEALDELVRSEKFLKTLPYQSALVMGVSQNGGICYSHPSRFGIERFATETGMDNCARYCGTREFCRVVMVNGDFNEAAFVEFARGFGKRSVKNVRDILMKDLPRQR